MHPIVDVPSVRMCKLAKTKAPVERNIAQAAKRKNVVRVVRQRQKQQLRQIQQQQQNKQRQTKIENEAVGLIASFRLPDYPVRNYLRNEQYHLHQHTHRIALQ